MARKKARKKVETITHDEASRRNIPTAEHQPMLDDEVQQPIQVAYERRNRDLDPQLVWRGKDEQDWSDLVVHAPPLFIQEKVHPKVLIDDLMRRSKQSEDQAARQGGGLQADLFADFNGVESAARTEFYQHDANWTNRMILGDSLQVMASLAEREGLRGRVQCIYFDPPYGIRFNSNFQWSTTTRDVKDGSLAHITREPEQVRAFRDTWRDGVHSYLSFIRDRMTVARDLLTESGSLFIQIGDENVHRVRAVAEEVFGPDNCVAQITIEKTSSQTQDYMSPVTDYVLWFAKHKKSVKYRAPWVPKQRSQSGFAEYSRLAFPDLSRRPMTREEKANPDALPSDARVYRQDNLTSQSIGREKGEGAASWFPVSIEGVEYRPSLANRWKTSEDGMRRLRLASRLEPRGKSLSYVRFIDDFPVVAINNIWTDVKFSSRSEDKTYIVQTSAKTIQRCVLMTTDPGDLVLDPTCGSGTAAAVAEQWGRRWITVDTSRVALALARSRIMGARYPYYILSDSRSGQVKEAEMSNLEPSSQPVFGNIKHGFVYERVPHITLRAIANNREIDVIAEKWRGELDEALAKMNAALKTSWEAWEVPREVESDWADSARSLHAHWWKCRRACHDEIEASIAAKADFEYLYDRPFEESGTVRVAGPFTVESLSPHRSLIVGAEDQLVDPKSESQESTDYMTMVLGNLGTAGVQQARKDDRIEFESLDAWPGSYIAAEAIYHEGAKTDGVRRRAAIFVGPEFGTVARPDLVAAAREAADAGFDVLIACAFSYDAHASDFESLGKVPVLKAHMNADLHMGDDLKNTGKGNLFVVFGEPDIEILPAEGEPELISVKIRGVDVFHPNTGEVRSDGADGIACWFIDTDYNEESFFVRHAYFLGANDPYRSLRTTLKAEIDKEAWETLNSDTSRPFPKPSSGRIAVKVINHLGDEVMKVYRVD